MLLIALGWKPDPVLTGKWQICLSGFMSWQGELALCDWWIFSGRPCGWCKEPSCSALLCSARRDAAQAAWELELSGAGLGNEEGAYVQALGCESCTQKGGTAQASLKIPFRCLCYPTHPSWGGFPDGSKRWRGDVLSATILRFQIPLFLIVKQFNCVLRQSCYWSMYHILVLSWPVCL